MGQILVTASQLKAAANDLEGLNSQLKSAIGSLESSEGSLASMWEGEAKQAFHSAFSKDKSSMDMFYANIQKYIAALNASAAKYEQAEAANVATANQRSV